MSYAIRTYRRPYDVAAFARAPRGALGELVPPADAVGDVVFKGCENRVRVAAYMAALAMESRVQGFVVGAVAGLIGGAALFVYLRGGAK